MFVRLNSSDELASYLASRRLLFSEGDVQQKMFTLVHSAFTRLDGTSGLDSSIVVGYIWMVCVQHFDDDDVARNQMKSLIYAVSPSDEGQQEMLRVLKNLECAYRRRASRDWCKIQARQWELEG